MVSTIANKLFQEIINNLPLDDINQCITHILGKELMIKNDKRHYLLDFTLVLKKKCIEFNGDYFHCNPASFKETFYNSRIKKFAKDIWQADEIKKQAILSCGLELLIVWENDYRKNPQEIVQKCLNFINS
jgi:very-short-patch-repair endonuclease